MLRLRTGLLVLIGVGIAVAYDSDLRSYWGSSHLPYFRSFPELIPHSHASGERHERPHSSEERHERPHSPGDRHGPAHAHSSGERHERAHSSGERHGRPHSSGERHERAHSSEERHERAHSAGEKHERAPTIKHKPTTTTTTTTEKPHHNEFLACTLPEDRGECSSVTTRYHFDFVTGKCNAFDYKGSGGNENNFKSVEECESFGRKCTPPKKPIFDYPVGKPPHFGWGWGSRY